MKSAESAPFRQGEDQTYAKPSQQNHQKMGIILKSFCDELDSP